MGGRREEVLQNTTVRLARQLVQGLKLRGSLLNKLIKTERTEFTRKRFNNSLIRIFCLIISIFK